MLETSRARRVLQHPIHKSRSSHTKTGFFIKTKVFLWVFGEWIRSEMKPRRTWRALLSSIDENSSHRIHSPKTHKKTFVFMKNPVFVWNDSVLFKKYGLYLVELVEFYFPPSMKASGSSVERIHSPETHKKPLFLWKIRFLCEMIRSYLRNMDWML